MSALPTAWPRFDQSTPAGRKRSNRVEFEIVEQPVPGEHGFRFFPTFYRHLFDTMRRTPMFDDAGRVRGDTAFEQLVPTPESKIALKDGDGPRDLQMRGVTSVSQINALLKLFVDDLEMTPRDLLGLQFFTLRYLLSGASRRQKEAEPISFIDYIQTICGPGPAPDGSPPKSRFSKAALDFIDQAPRALAAMSARESDARTQYDIAAQLMMVQPNSPAFDMTLNGPTTTSWLDHWKTYLKVQGVRFFTAQIDQLQAVGARLLPTFVQSDTKSPNLLSDDPDHLFLYPDDDTVDQHRYVLATSFQHASDVIWGAFHSQPAGANPAVSAGPFEQLMTFDMVSGRRKPGDKTAPDPTRDPATGKPPETYPLRTISGLQYFFPENYRFGQGNVFFVDTPWALTSNSQLPYWRDRVRPVGQLLGQITVDVGNWHNFYPEATAGALPGHPAWYSSRQEIADKTWSQIKEDLPTDYAGLIKPPAYFHIDRNIIFGEYTQLGYQGSAVFRVVKPIAENLRPALPTIQVSAPARWARYLPDPPPNRSKDRIGVEGFIAALQNSLGDSVFAVPLPIEPNAAGQEHHDVLVSPTASGTRFVIAFRGRSNKSFHLSIDGRLAEPLHFEEAGQRLEALQQRLAPDDVNVEQLDRSGTTFALSRTDNAAFRLGVANEDGAIELLDGPILSISDTGDAVRLIRAPLPASGRATLVAVRANAVIRLPKTRADGADDDGIQPGRAYGIAFGIGVSEPTDPNLSFAWEAMAGETAFSVRNRFFNMIKNQSDKLLVQSLGDSSLVQSPIASLRRAVISFLGTSSQPYVIYLDGDTITLSADGVAPVDRRGELMAQIGPQFVVKRLDGGAPPDRPALSVTHVDPTVPFRIGVLNVDGMVELVGAPALTIATKDFIIEEPASGFVVLRNDAEYLINIPDQFRIRPGLLRGPDAAAIPAGYNQLSRLFGNKNTEIYYGHPAPLLKNWVTAGTYMATYTRITTMESANESGRHAASSIIYDVQQTVSSSPNPEPVLVADLPQIWKVEDNEMADLKFFTDLDEALFADGLPHVLDILSVTPLVAMLLEADLQDDKVRAFLLQVKSILDGMMPMAHQGLKIGGQLFSQLLGAYADLTKGIVGALGGSDPTTVALKQLLDKVQEASRTYKALWGE